MDNITPFLWFEDKAEEAVNYYISVFGRDSKIVTIARYNDAIPAMKGKVLTAVFTLRGREFMAIDGGPGFPFTEAISLSVNCETQEEVDELWKKLSAGGREGQCGWLKDKYGLSWQIVPAGLGKLMQGAPAKAKRVTEALMKMKKLNMPVLQKAYDEV